ncbi:MAG: thermonuclease family protein [Hyphomicrobiales bacterium]|nr:thermonuclease family protein [Hyphomicrobiales bacterium]
MRHNRALDLLLFCLIVFGLLAVVWFLPEPEHKILSGHARVIDGDSLIVDGMEIRLLGIDSLELEQTCSRDGRRWECGKFAARRLRVHLGSTTVTCQGNRFDQYDRLLAVCTAKEVEINRWLVDRGWAVSFGDYGAVEDEARKAGRGAWSGRFDRPLVWRERQRDLP